MAGFRTAAAAQRAIVDEGKYTYFTWRKTPAVVTTSGVWIDLSMIPGNPIPNYYANAPLIAAALSGNEGLFVGGAVDPSSKHLHQITVASSSATGLPVTLLLCDYLLYYPFVDQGSTDAQVMTNTVTLPRYADGGGVQMMAVLQAPQTGGQSFFVTYTNQDGVAGRTSETVTCNTANVNGTLVTAATLGPTGRCAGPFIPLQSGDSGVRAVESVTMLGTDVGLMAIVLVKPLVTTRVQEQIAANERDYVKDFFSAPRIYDGAYLNLLCLPSGSLSGVTLIGSLATMWT